MATVSKTLGTSGYVITNTTTELVAAASNTYYTITAFNLDWNSNGAYILSGYPARTFTISLQDTSGTTLVTIGTYSYNNNGSRPTISWTGSVNVTAGRGINYVMSSTYDSGTCGIKNAFIVNLTYTSASVYTSCTAPTSVSVASTNVAPGASVKLSWSGASAGTNNAITGYHVYRATSASGTYSYLSAVSSTSTSSSTTVTAPTTSGSAYYYKVYTIGTVSGYNSGASSAYATLTCSCTKPTAPTSVSVSSTNVKPSATVTLSWSGASAGTNNAITGYQIYRATSASGTYSSLATVSSTSTSGSYSVTAPSSSGSSYYYKIYTVGTYSSYSPSTISSAYATLTCTYTAPTAPTSISLSKTAVLPSTNVTLSWSGAASGTNNAITSYHIYRSTSSSGTYTHIATVTTTATSGSTTVASNSSYNSSYYYRVYAIGTYSNSGASGTVALKSVGASSGSITCSKKLTTSTATFTISNTIGTGDTFSSFKLYYQTSSDGSTWGSETLYGTYTSAQTSITTSTLTSGYFYKFYAKLTTAAGYTATYSGTPVIYRWSGSWTDTLTSGSTLIKATHMTEIQNLANKARIAYGLSTQSFTTITAGSTQLSGWSSHVGEIRTAANACASKTYTTISANNCSAAIMNELRTNVAAL